VCRPRHVELHINMKLILIHCCISLDFLYMNHTKEVVCARHESVWCDWGFISTYSMSQRVMDVSGEVHVPVDLPAGKGPHYPLRRRVSGFRSGWRTSSATVTTLSGSRVSYATG